MRPNDRLAGARGSWHGAGKMCTPKDWTGPLGYPEAFLDACQTINRRIDGLGVKCGNQTTGSCILNAKGDR